MTITVGDVRRLLEGLPDKAHVVREDHLGDFITIESIDELMVVRSGRLDGKRDKRSDVVLVRAEDDEVRETIDGQRGDGDDDE